MIKSTRFFWALLLLFSFFACEKEEPVDETATVFFGVDNLQEVENATLPLGINIGIDNPLHKGGSIMISVTGGAYGEEFTTSEESADFSIDVEPNSLYARFSILPVDDDIIEDNVTLTVTITGVTGFLELGDQTSFTLTIIDNDKEPDPLSVDFAETITSIGEDAGTVTISIITSDTLSEDATVDVLVNAASTAVIGDDYTLNGQTGTTVTVAFLAGTDSATLDLEINDDAIEEEPETIVLELANPSSAFLIGVTRPELTFTISDNDITPYTYLETFESNDGTPEYLNDVLGFQNVLVDQTIAPENIISLITNAGSFSDPDDVTAPSDNGLNIFYNSAQDPLLFGDMDNVVITPIHDVDGLVQVHIDVSYAFKNQNNGEVTFYWSQDYDGSGTFNAGDWTVMGTETALGMDGEGYGNNAYKREAFTIEPTAPFYIAIRVTQTIDNDFYRTRWRFDNIRVEN